MMHTPYIENSYDSPYPYVSGLRSPSLRASVWNPFSHER